MRRRCCGGCVVKMRIDLTAHRTTRDVCSMPIEYDMSAGIIKTKKPRWKKVQGMDGREERIKKMGEEESIGIRYIPWMV